jgi:Uma2 family endonuclease
MATQLDEARERLLYPDSDGKALADNTLQLQWIVILYGNLCALFADDEEVVVFADLLWYAVEGKPAESTAPDTMVVFGRPKGYRGSYKQWQEGNVSPQVAFEVLSPRNSAAEMARRFAFFERHGVEEYYLIDPYAETVTGWRRRGRKLRPIAEMNGWVSPRLGIRFSATAPEVVLYYPDGRAFLSFEQLAELEQTSRRRELQARRRAVREQREREKAEQAAAEAVRQADESRRQADESRRQAEAAQRRAERLAAKLRELGIEPEEPANNHKRKKTD